MIKRLSLTTATLALLAAPFLAPGIAAAQDSPFSANVALTSKYKFRGQDQSDESKAVLPAIQGGFDYSAGGFYIGNWNSSIGFGHGTEVDFYAGFSGEAGSVAYDVGVLQYLYPGSGTSELNTTELYGSVGFGPLTAKYSHTVSSKWFGATQGRNTGYLELNLEYGVAESVTLVAHLGQTLLSSGVKDQGGANYADYKLGAGFDLGSGFSAELAVVGATKKNAWGDINKTRLVFTLSKSM